MRRDERGADGLDARDAVRIFGDDACDRRGAKNPAGAECFQVGLDAGARAVVGAGHGQGDGLHRLVRRSMKGGRNLDKPFACPWQRAFLHSQDT
ncbi:hypothetical protein QQ054_06940 [Oscillatoria amoena NRMC-F 0135]|nr:hypothetical protein [Oscillatoria amoena NRMC-F 0135]